MQKRSKLIVFAGLPGTGKTTLARKLAIKLNYFYLRVDCIEAPFSAEHPKAGEKGEGYQALINLAYENLVLGHNVIIDTVNPLHISRAMFNELKDKTNSKIIQFELKTKNVSLHKVRVENRKPDVEGLKIPSWNDVIEREYEEWNKEVDGINFEIWTDDMEDALNRCLSIIAEKIDPK